MSEFVRQVKRLAKPIASRLGKLDIELTERCNNNCIHCCINRPANDAHARVREMTTAQVKDILQQAAHLGCLQVRFTGGEPLLRGDFEKLYLFARHLGMKVLLFTNGRLISPHRADLFARIPPLVEIEITVYGMRQESYEAVARVPGSFAQFWCGVQLLLERKVPFVVKSTLLPPNRGDMDEFETWAKTIPWMTQHPGYSVFFDLRSRRDDADKNALITSMHLSAKESLAVLMRDEGGYRKEMAEFAMKFMGPRGEKLFTCGAGCAVCVDAYGCVQPCMGMRAPELTYHTAGANDHSLLRDALDQFSHLRELRATNPDYLRRCAACFLKGLCEQCPAKSWTEYGTLDTPVERLCQEAHSEARWLGWLGESENGWEVAAWRERIQTREGER